MTFASGLGGFNDGAGQLDQYVPTDLVQLDDGRWIATTLGGPIRLIGNDGALLDSQAAPYLFPPTQVGGFGGELNFGATATEPHPDFLTPGAPGYGKLYAIVTRSQSTNLPVDFGFGDSHKDLLIEYTADDPTSNTPSWTGRRVLTIQQPAPIHNLFDLDFGPDGYLYASVGDGGAEWGTTQDLSTIFGALLRINPLDPQGEARAGEKLSENGRYTIPLDNPLVGQPGLVEEAWAFGLRSPFTLNFSSNGDLYQGDVGQGQREEVNLIQRGDNQGWPVFEGTRPFDRGVTLAPGTLHNPPVFEYTHAEGRSVIAGFVYDGDFFPKLRGKFIFGDFQGQTEEQETPVGRLFYGDLATGEIFEFNYSGMGLEGISLLNIAQDADGELFVATSVASTAEQAPSDPASGAVLRLAPVFGGDYNGDGVVGAADYTVWRDTLGGVDLAADGNGDGVIGPSDLPVWQFNYGATVSGESESVPEPRACFLLAQAAAIPLTRYRRRLAGRVAQPGSDRSPPRLAAS